MNPRHFLDIDQFNYDLLRHLVDEAHSMKQAGRNIAANASKHAGQVLIMIFEKPSTRTRLSFDVAMRQLGGETIIINSNDTQLGRGETIGDTARVLSRYGDSIMLRTTAHTNLLELAENATIPVINGLTDLTHPCQIMADIMTFEEHRHNIEKSKIAWIGDGNNVASSWIHAAARFGFSLRIGCPDIYRPDRKILDWAHSEKADIMVTDDPVEAAKGADCIVTDVWVSMGQADADIRAKNLAPFQVNGDLMAYAGDDAIFMHCLPAHRGEEVTEDVLDGPQSVVFDEAENRVYAQKAILSWCLEKV